MEHLFTANKILWSTSVFVYMIFPQHNPGRGQLHPHFTKEEIEAQGDDYHNGHKSHTDLQTPSVAFFPLHHSCLP